MGFADARVCPSCRGQIEDARRCPHCGLDLTTHEIQQAWQALVVADQWVQRARTLQSAGGATSPAAATPGSPPTATEPARKRSISAGSVLLGLGAAFILVAGSIFISVTWGSLGVLGRALVLLAVTALIGALGAFVTRRGLRPSAEAVWSVFLGLLTLDWFAARDQGLGGLDTWPFGLSASVWAALVIGTALVVVPMGRRRVSKELLAPAIAAGAAAWFAAGSLASELSDAIASNEEFWPGLLATAVTTVVAVVLRRASARAGAWVSLAGTGVFGLFAIGSALAEAVDHPTPTGLLVDLHGLPLVVVAVVAVATGVLAERARVGASALAVASVATLVILPVEEAWPERGGFVMLAGLVATGAWLLTRAGDWFRGLRLAVALAGLGLTVAAVPWVARLMSTVAEGASAPRVNDLSTRLRPDDGLEFGPWWLALVVAAGLAAGSAGARRWPDVVPARAHLAPAAWCVAVLGAMAAAATFELPAVSLGSSLVIGGALLAATVRPSGWRWAGPAVVALAPVATISSWPASVFVWPTAGLALAVVAVRTRAVLLRAAAAFVATGWGLGTIGPALELVEGDPRWTALGLVAAGLVGLAIAAFAVRDHRASYAVEAAASSLGAIGLAIGSDESTLGFASFICTVAGAGIVILGLVSGRAWYRWVGSGLLGVAYVLRLLASDVEVVEAYTAPFAVFLLAVGLWAMRTPDGPGSVRALLPGVTLALVPSLPAALDEPTSLRALLLGLTAAVALGVGVWRRWKVPFVAGALVLAVLVLVNLGPPALALPRWVLIASAGAVLLGAGITWDDRVRDGRAAIRYVGSMR